MTFDFFIFSFFSGLAIWSGFFFVFFFSSSSSFFFPPGLAIRFFLFFYFLNFKKKKRNPDRTTNPGGKKKRKKKKPDQIANPEKKEKKKSKVKSCSWVLFVGLLCVFNYNITIELWVMKTENSQNVFSVSITHNSKIRELSDGNRVMETELSFTKQPFCHGSHHFWVELWKLRIELRKQVN